MRFAALIMVVCMAFASVSRAQNGLDLRGADLEGFVRIVAEETGRSFVLDPGVAGTVTVVAPEGVTREALFEIFLNVLELNGLTIVQGEEADRIAPLGTAAGLSSPSPSGGSDGGFETRVLGLRNADASDVAEVVRPLLPPEAVISVVPSSQLLIISDRRKNFRRIEALISNLDRPRASQIETITVLNGNATDMVEVIEELDVVPSGATISADARSNAVILSGPTEFRAKVRQLVSRLDTPQRSVATRVIQLAYADASQLEDVIQRSFGALLSDGDALGQTTVVADKQSNSIIVTAPSDRINAIVGSIRGLDRRPKQVLIEALVFEVSVQTFADLSVQFGALLNDAVLGGAQFSLDGRATLGSVLSNANSGQTPAIGNGGVVAGAKRQGKDGFAGFLTALNEERTTRVLATPSILTLDNQEAEIIVAQNVPFVTGSFSTVGDSAVPDQPFQTIERQDVGLKLRVTPQITVDETVRLAILQEVSNLTNSSSEAGGEITSIRSVRTNVIVRDGRVIMLGGLLENGNGSVGQSVPGASRLPVIGNLFRGRNARTDQRVLLVMLRPRIVSNDHDAERLTREAARDARRASRLLQPVDDGRYPATPDGTLPFDGNDLNQPFDADFVDNIARERHFPPLPSPLRFREGEIAP